MTSLKPSFVDPLIPKPVFSLRPRQKLPRLIGIIGLVASIVTSNTYLHAENNSQAPQSTFLGETSRTIAQLSNQETSVKTGFTPIFYSSDGFPTEQLRTALSSQARAKLNGRNAEILDIAGLKKREIEMLVKQADTCVMTIGPKVTQQILSMRRPLQHFSLFTPRHLLDKLHRIYQPLKVPLTGVYEEQPFVRQLYLSRAIDPTIESIAIILDQKDKFYLPEFEQIARQQNLSLNYRILKPTDAPEKYLDDVADPDTFLMLTNNEQLYTPSKISAMILAAYYRRIKLVGNHYESGQAGALASIFTPLTTLAIESMTDFAKICETNRSMPPRYARSFSVIINQQIASNLNLGLLQPNLLSKTITQMENQQVTK